MQTLDNYNFNGKKAFGRVAFNVPLNSEMQIIDYTRMVKALPTINTILSVGGSVIIGSYLGPPILTPTS